MNAEFKRNLLIEITPQRIVLPLLIGFMTYSITNAGASYGSGNVFFWAFAGLTTLWGARLAGDAVPEEIRDRTWDNQRMSSVGPWALTWGKLFGSTIYAWYCGLLALAFYLLGYPAADDPEREFEIILTVIGMAVFLQSLCLISSMEGARATTKRGRGFFGLLALIAASSGGPALMRSAKTLGMTVSWYEMDFDRLNFMLISTTIFAVWSLLGAYRSMRSELLYRSAPTVWLGFILFLCVYLNGFPWIAYNQLKRMSVEIPPDRRLQTAVLISFSISLISAWFMLIVERKDIVQLRKAVSKLGTPGERGQVFTLLPKWLVSIVLAAVFLCSAFALAETRGRLEGDFEFSSNLLAAACFIFCVRDSLIVLLCHLSSRFRHRANTAALIYFGCLYVLIPWFLASSHGVGVLRFFVPMPMKDAADLIWPALQIPLFGFLTVLRWKNH